MDTVSDVTSLARCRHKQVLHILSELEHEQERNFSHIPIRSKGNHLVEKMQYELIGLCTWNPEKERNKKWDAREVARYIFNKYHKKRGVPQSAPLKQLSRL
ncbi:hypothetical protein EIP91_002210 [Steccherinum ochraceum]|uniref:Uncharacterized protein n=1 Tax=Steccherinum ochraceum TaxID=92696 RepID=A0A4R0RCM2_9APHY|nr:hypothetical protein EIP91_002210 [Steccherinum ochraceum]